MSINKDHILSKNGNITVGDVLQQGHISYKPSYSGAEVLYFVNDENTAIIRRIINHETFGEPTVSYKRVYEL